MHDPRRPARAPFPDWGTALAQLPAEDPPRDAWQRLSAALGARVPEPRAAPRPVARLPRPAAWLAMAATLALAVALPWRAMQPGADRDALPSGTAATAPLEPLLAESAQLEALLAHARDGRVSTGTAAAMAAQLDARLAAIDAELALAGLTPARERALWNARVGVLRQLVGFEGARRWLAVNGDAYEGALVRVD